MDVTSRSPVRCSPWGLWRGENAAVITNPSLRRLPVYWERGEDLPCDPTASDNIISLDLSSIQVPYTSEGFPSRPEGGQGNGSCRSIAYLYSMENTFFLCLFVRLSFSDYSSIRLYLSDHFRWFIPLCFGASSRLFPPIHRHIEHDIDLSPRLAFGMQSFS